MNKTIGLQLVAYSLLLAGFSYFAYHLVPALAQPTLIVGLAGGALCLVWGIRAVAGSTGKALPILTLIPIAFVMLSQTVMTWGGGTQEVPGRRTATVVITLLFVLSLAMVMRIAYAGLLFDGQASGPPKDGGAKPQTSGKPATQANAGKRA
jgi:hypothetical protein